MSKTLNHRMVRIAWSFPLFAGLFFSGWLFGQRTSLPFVGAQESAEPQNVPAVQGDPAPTNLASPTSEPLPPGNSPLPALSPGTALPETQTLGPSTPQSSQDVPASPGSSPSNPDGNWPQNLPVPPISDGNPAVESRIRKALTQEDARQETGDAILDGILEVVREQGSVLDGSSLDARAVDPPVLDPRVTSGSAAGETDSRKWLVAEMLLKTSRMLESIERTGGGQVVTGDGLVSAMRRKASDLIQVTGRAPHSVVPTLSRSETDMQP